VNSRRIRGDVAADDTADREDIRDLCSRYAIMLDDHDWDGLSSVFTADVTVDFGPLGEVAGLPNVVGACRAVPEGLDASQHLHRHRAARGAWGQCPVHQLLPGAARQRGWAGRGTTDHGRPVRRADARPAGVEDRSTRPEGDVDER
jgi:hypothetical protein